QRAGRNPESVRVREQITRLQKLRSVKQVVNLNAELGLESFIDAGVFIDSDVGVDVRWSGKHVTHQSARASERCVRESREERPSLCTIRAANGRIGDQVCPAVRPCMFRIN